VSDEAAIDGSMQVARTDGLYYEPSTGVVVPALVRLRADGADANANLPRLARLAEVWEKINRAARDTAEYNLERKPLVFSVFGLLAEATR